MANADTNQNPELSSFVESEDPATIFERRMSAVTADTELLTAQLDRKELTAALRTAVALTIRWIEGCNAYRAIPSAQQRSQGPVKRMAHSLLIARRRAILDQLDRLNRSPPSAEDLVDAMELRVTVEQSIERLGAQ